MLAILTVPYAIMLGSQAHHSHLAAEQSLCPFMMLTGLPCPGCGITKAMIATYQGDLVGSIRYHIFGPIAVVACLAGIALLLVELATGRTWFDGIIYSRPLGIVIAVVLMAYHALRLIYYLATHTTTDILQATAWA